MEVRNRAERERYIHRIWKAIVMDLASDIRMLMPYKT